MDHLSRRAYARHRGCSEMSVRRALQEGRISLAEDGLIDPERADRQWRANTCPPRVPKASPEGSVIEGLELAVQILPELALWKAFIVAAAPELVCLARDVAARRTTVQTPEEGTVGTFLLVAAALEDAGCLSAAETELGAWLLTQPAPTAWLASAEGQAALARARQATRQRAARQEV